MAPHFTGLDDLLADPLIQKVMRADRVDAGALRRELLVVAARTPRPRIALSGASVRFGCEPQRPAPLPLATLADGGGRETCLYC